MFSHENEIQKYYVIDLPDDDNLTKTYSSHLSSNYKTNILGLDPECDQKFKAVPINETIILADILDIRDIQQKDLNNCAFLSTLRAIARTYPEFLSSMIKEIDNDHVSVRLFDKDGNMIFYTIEKTIITPKVDDITSFFQSAFSFFNPYKHNGEKAWVKLIEKALVLHIMRTSYPGSLMNIQNYGRKPFDLSIEEKGIIPSYEDILIIIGNSDLVFMSLIGCKATTHFSHYNKPNEMNVKNEYMKGELITVTFLKNDFGFEQEHTYELVDFASDEKDNYVILSNPWGFNNKTSQFNYHQLNIDKLELMQDKGCIIIPENKFYQIIDECHVTKNACLKPAEVKINTHVDMITKEFSVKPDQNDSTMRL